MAIEEFLDLLEAADVFDLTYSVKEAKIAYVEAMITEVDEQVTREHTKMRFLEFYEAVAHVAAKRVPDDSPLALKLPTVLEVLIGLLPPPKGAASAPEPPPADEDESGSADDGTVRLGDSHWALGKKV
mmetsp:Transcript_112137/g.311621  ORF Transcript_112137/g.311621 Transcript_112137/m.311621 type:complete len:128 (+) Transcript_112137:2-385(+)